MKPTLAMLSSFLVLLAACATTRQPPLDAELQSDLRRKAQECMRANPAILRYEVNRFGTVTAYYRGPEDPSITDPFFECVFRRK